MARELTTLTTGGRFFEGPRWRDGTWWQPGTWASAWRVLMGPQGMVRLGLAPWRRYLHEDFHPSQGDGSAAQQWLAANAGLAPPVRTS